MGAGGLHSSDAAPRRAIASWMLSDWAAQPWPTLVTSFVFGPFFATRIASDPAQGQVLWGYAAAGAGLVIALAAPLLGAIADHSGSRKPWIAGLSGILVAACIALWFVTPGGGASIAIGLLAFGLGTVASELATVLTNAMMPDLVARHRLGRLSGTGWAVGYSGGLVSLLLLLAFVIADPTTGRTMLGLAPVFGLDPDQFQGDRAVGPFTAVWYLVFVAPLFLFVPDRLRRAALAEAVRGGAATLATTLRGLPRNRNVARFLVASMLYLDGVTALGLFGALYGASVFGWGALELVLLGIFLIIAGILGAVTGGRLDERIGPRRLVLGALAVLTFACIAIPSIDATHVFFIVPVAAPAGADGLFAATGERAYLLLAIVVGAAVAPLQAASRTLLVHIAPPERLTQFFGLYGLAGRLTSFVGPLVVGSLTAATGSQRIGVSVLALFFILGAAALAGVRPARSGAGVGNAAPG